MRSPIKTSPQNEFENSSLRKLKLSTVINEITYAIVTLPYHPIVTLTV